MRRKERTYCHECGYGRNCINGRWCVMLGTYVEHRDYPPCWMEH